MDKYEKDKAILKKIESTRPEVFKSKSIKPIREYLRVYREENILSEEERLIIHSLIANISKLQEIYPDKSNWIIDDSIKITLEKKINQKEVLEVLAKEYRKMAETIEKLL